jgi:glycosyltransferase involved in cell wall biosynthesis
MDAAEAGIVISAGFHKTHETTAAREASARGLLRMCITGAYPTERFKRLARRLGIADKGRVARLLDRDEGIPADRLESLILPESLDEFGAMVGRLPLLRRLQPCLTVISWRLYGHLAARRLRRARGARIFHYRAGFGQAAVRRAKELGMLALCDRSLAHPLLIGDLIENRGSLRPDVVKHARSRDTASVRDHLTRAILTDLEQADAVLVNSAFVKDGFLALGWPSDRVHTVYLGIDDNFLSGASQERRAATRGRLQLLFAGRLERRKGADVLIEAMAALDDVDWELQVAGPVAPEIARMYGDFLDSERVKLLGVLRRSELLRRMQSVPVFVFPSFAEGSARVVFEALACGCFVITTPNSGTIVEDDVHGALVEPGSAQALREAIRQADADRQRLAEIGNRNMDLVARRYSQSTYGDALASLYRELAGDGATAGSTAARPVTDRAKRTPAG